MAYIDSLKILLFVLKFNLFITQFFPQPFLLLIQMQKHLNISIKFSLLLRLNNLLNFSLFDHILCLLLMKCFNLFFDFNFDLSLKLSKLLSLLPDVFVHP